MTERLTSCPTCKKVNVETIRILNPETHDLNASADLKCLDCGEQWVGKVTSPHYQKMKSRGWVR